MLNADSFRLQLSRVCITNSKHPSCYSAVACLVGGDLLVLVPHFYLGYKAAFTGSHLIFRNVLLLVVPYKARYICALGSEEVHRLCQMALIFSYCAQVHPLVIGAMVEIKGDPQGCSNLYLICSVHQQGAQESRCKFWSLASIDSALLCIKMLYKNNVLVKLNHDLSVHEDVIHVTFF